MVSARKIAYNVVLNAFFKIFSTVALSLLSIRLITGYLGQDGFGKYATVLAFFAFFSALADLGLGPVATREISREGADEKRILSNVIALRLVSALALVVLSPLIIYFFRYSSDVKIGIFFAAVAILFSTLSSVLNGIFQKYLAMDKVAMIEFCGKIVQVGLVVLIVHNNWGFLPIAATLLASISFNALAALFYSRRYAQFRLEFDRAYWKRFLKESWPMGATAIITFSYFKMDTILLSVLQSSSHVGIYNVAYKIMENLIFFPAMLAGLILPLISRYIFTDRAQFEEIANKTFKVFFIIILPIIVGTFLLAPQIIRIVSGPHFEASVPVLRILVFALGFIFFGQYFNMLLVAGNAQRKLMQSLVFAAVFNIGLNIFFIREFSYIGAAVTSLLTEGFVVVLTSYLTRRHLHFSPALDHFGKVVLSGAAMGIVVFFLQPFSFLLAGFAGILVYLGALWLSRAVSEAEITSLFQKEPTPREAVEQMENMLP